MDIHYVKQHRNLTRFSGHGLNAAHGEFGLTVLVHRQSLIDG